jgi:cytochrome b pre-mRNA-processing protein 3
MCDMFGFRRRDNGRAAVDALHHRIVAQSREPAFYEGSGLPDTIEGRFESLALHSLLVLRRLRKLPAPADDVAQDLVDRVFAHLEIALREMGVGDMGVPKRMKKIAGAFYDRTRLYDPLIAAGDADGLAVEIAGHLGVEPRTLVPLARYCLASENAMAGCGLGDMLAAPCFASLDVLNRAEVAA